MHLCMLIAYINDMKINKLYIIEVKKYLQYKRIYMQLAEVSSKMQALSIYKAKYKVGNKERN